MSSLSNGRVGGSGNGPATNRWLRLWRKVRGLLGLPNGESRLRDTIEEIIGGIEETTVDDDDAAIGRHEKILLSNILRLGQVTAHDVMVPRADIVSVDIAAGLEEVIAAMSGAGHSRLPVYRENLDDVVGLAHIKDVIEFAKGGRDFDLSPILREVTFVAPSMRALDLLLDMRLSRVHMAVVVDEFGGIDGLITIEDLVEEIVGEIEDEHDVAEGPNLVVRPDGSLVANARATIEEFEALVGPILSDEERDEDIDTLGGLVVQVAERVPTRHELIEHPASGITFEVLEADPRRVKRLQARNLPSRPAAAGGEAGGED